METYCRWLVVLFLGLGLASTNLVYASGDDHYEAETHAASESKGPHGGRLLSEGGIAAEITIFERGMPPHFRVYVYDDKKLISPKKSSLQITLKRFSGEINTIHFEPMDDFLQSREVIEEPHSFDVTVTLNYNEKNYSWHYASYEGRVKLSPEVIQAAGIMIAIANTTRLEKKLSVVGKIVPNRDTMAPIYPRYSGIIKSLTKNLGDAVQKGDAIATIESNESLQNYVITAPITGTIVQKNTTVGELVKEDKPIYEIANLDTVWADLTLYRKEAPLVKKGMKVTVTGDEGKPKTSTSITYISPLGIEDSQTILARAVLPNAEQVWLPGMYVNAAITIADKSVPVAVPYSALQRWRDWDVVFVKQGNTFEAAPVTLGEQDGDWIEITAGLKAGQSYVADNSFFLKADLDKAGASHDH